MNYSLIIPVRSGSQRVKKKNMFSQQKKMDPVLGPKRKNMQKEEKLQKTCENAAKTTKTAATAAFS